MLSLQTNHTFSESTGNHVIALFIIFVLGNVLLVSSSSSGKHPMALEYDLFLLSLTETSHLHRSSYNAIPQHSQPLMQWIVRPFPIDICCLHLMTFALARDNFKTVACPSTPFCWLHFFMPIFSHLRSSSITFTFCISEIKNPMYTVRTDCHGKRDFYDAHD